jgi:hypothetical protein
VIRLVGAICSNKMMMGRGRALLQRRMDEPADDGDNERELESAPGSDDVYGGNRDADSQQPKGHHRSFTWYNLDSPGQRRLCSIL